MDANCHVATQPISFTCTEVTDSDQNCSQKSSSAASTGDVLVVSWITALRKLSLVSVLPILKMGKLC